MNSYEVPWPFHAGIVRVAAPHLDAWRRDLAADWFMENPREAAWIADNTAGAAVAAVVRGNIPSSQGGSVIEHGIVLLFATERDRDAFAEWMEGRRREWETRGLIDPSNEERCLECNGPCEERTVREPWRWGPFEVVSDLRVQWCSHCADGSHVCGDDTDLSDRIVKAIRRATGRVGPQEPDALEEYRRLHRAPPVFLLEVSGEADDAELDRLVAQVMTERVS